MENIGKVFNQKLFTLGIGGSITGVLIALAGLAMMILRIRLAVVFLSARVFLDMPFDNTDVIKIGAMMMLAIAVILTGLAIFLFGTAMSLIQFSRKKAI